MLSASWTHCFSRYVNNLQEVLRRLRVLTEGCRWPCGRIIAPWKTHTLRETHVHTNTQTLAFHDIWKFLWISSNSYDRWATGAVCTCWCVCVQQGSVGETCIQQAAEWDSKTPVWSNPPRLPPPLLAHDTWYVESEEGRGQREWCWWGRDKSRRMGTSGENSWINWMFPFSVSCCGTVRTASAEPSLQNRKAGAD